MSDSANQLNDLGAFNSNSYVRILTREEYVNHIPQYVTIPGAPPGLKLVSALSPLVGMVEIMDKSILQLACHAAHSITVDSVARIEAPGILAELAYYKGDIDLFLEHIKNEVAARHIMDLTYNEAFVWCADLFNLKGAKRLVLAARARRAALDALRLIG